MILLTGGTGFVGRHLVSQFAADKRRVRILSRKAGGATFPAGISQFQGDLADPASLRAAMQDVRTVVHAAAILPSATTPDAALEQVNAAGTGALAAAVRDMGVRRFVHISSAGVYGDGVNARPHQENDALAPITPYERSKLAAESALAFALEGSDVNWTVLRPQGLYGHDRPATAGFFRAVARKSFWFHGPSCVLVHPTHVADLVSAVQIVLDRVDLPGEIINIGGSRPLEFRELISLIGARVGHVPVQLGAPRWTGHLASVATRTWATVGTPPARLTRMARSYVNRAVSIEKARVLLAFEPVALEWGIEQTVTELHRKSLL